MFLKISIPLKKKKRNAKNTFLLWLIHGEDRVLLSSETSKRTEWHWINSVLIIYFFWDIFNLSWQPFLQAISARIQKQNVDFEKNIILYYQSLLQNNVYEDIPLIQNFILDYYTETNNKDMMIKILIDIKSFNDKDLTLKSSTLFTTSQS